jgi:DNA-binding NarL/FixJ family response regulator
VVVTDLRMPRLNRLGVLRKMIHIDPEVASLMLTASPSPERRADALALRCDGNVTKTVGLRQVKQAIVQCHGRRKRGCLRLDVEEEKRNGIDNVEFPDF